MGPKLSRLALPGVDVLVVDVTPDFYEIPYIVSYILVPPEGPLVVVDPGPRNPGCRLITEALDGYKERQVIIFVTHVHIDHGGAAGCLAAQLPGRITAIYVHPRGAPHLVDPARLWEASRRYLGWIAEGYGEPQPAPSQLVKPTRDTETVEIGKNIRAKILHTPGHASHHQSILVETAGGGGYKILFPGDSAGMAHPAVDAIAPTTPPPFRLDMYIESLRRQIRENPSLVAYTHTGLGEPVLLGRHLQQVEKWWSVAEKLVASSGGDPPGPEEMLEEVARIDDYTRRFLELASASKALYEALKHSAEGFLDYAMRRVAPGNR
jgi:hydroxyacylglutathione hydrolase